jgi:glycosyltransferase involved in cell wall biosynthesis
MHYGYIDSKKEYSSILRQGDIVISTASHEFYGISVIEAIRAGCYPLLPNRLSYPELVPSQYLYDEKELISRLQTFLQNPKKLTDNQAKSLTARFSWPFLRQSYLDWFKTSLN